MRPRRSVFALDYIAETVDAYVRVVKYAGPDHSKDKNLKWYTDVLENYFDVVDTSHPVISEQHKLYNKEKAILTATKKSIPYSRDFTKRKVSFDNFEAYANCADPYVGTMAEKYHGS